jgi:glycosyltransferase involved in cell wall biosynthesis
MKPGVVQAAIYVPHGDVPDERGFSPAIVAWQHGKRLRRFTPLFICARENTERPYREHKPAIFRLHEGMIYRRLFRKWTQLDPWPLHRRAAVLARRLAPTLWHAHQLEFPVNSFRSRFGRSIPVLVHAHVTSHRFSTERGVADRYLAVSHYVRERMIETLGYPANRVEVLPNGVDVNLFCPPSLQEKETLRLELGLPVDARIVLFAGRKQAVKGFDLFLAAVRALAPVHDDTYWLAVGPEPADAIREPAYQQRKRLARALTESGRYLDYPAMRHTDLARLFRASDVLFVPSKIETQGMVMIEGLAAGLVVVSSEVGGIRESITPATGFLLRSHDDLDEAVATLDGILDRLPTLDPMRRAAREDAVRRFAWDSIVEKLEQIYTQVLEENRA